MNLSEISSPIDKDSLKKGPKKFINRFLNEDLINELEKLSNLFYFLDKDILRRQLRKARIDKTPTQIRRYSITTFISILIIGCSLSIIFLENIFLLISVTLSFLLSFISLLMPYYYIKMAIGTRKRKINRNLGSAITFMYSLSSGNMKLPEIFRRLAIHENAFGEISREFKLVITEIDFFSSNLESAINELILNTPSDKLKKFLEDLIPIMRAGGDVTSYLSDKSEQYLSEAVEEQENFIEFLGYLSEVYIAGFVAGPLMIILGLVMLILSFGQAPKPMYYIIYLLLPLGGLLFIVLLKSISPIEKKKGKQKITYDYTAFTDISKKNIEKKRMKIPIKEKIFNFYRSLLEKPHLTLILSIPAYLIFLIIKIWLADLPSIDFEYYLSEWFNIITPIDFEFYITELQEWFNSLPPISFEYYIVIAMVTLLSPISIFYEIKNFRDVKIRGEFPEFLRIIEGLNKTGMTLKKTILEASGTPGIVGKYLKDVKRGIKWDLSLRNLLKYFSNKLNEKQIVRSIIIILEGTRAHSNISSVLRVTKNDSIKRKELKKTRKMNIRPYIILVWVAFLIFLFTAYVFKVQFLGSVPKSGGFETGRFGFSLGQVESISMIISHSSMIMGFISGIIAGELSKGSIYAGLKHSIIMVLVAYILFFTLI